jgi:hypothetical protein
VFIVFAELKEAVGGGDDIFDFGTGARFEERKRVDQHALVGDQFGGLLELGKCGAGEDALFEYGSRFQIGAGRKRGKLVVRNGGTPSFGDRGFFGLGRRTGAYVDQIRQIKRIYRQNAKRSTYVETCVDAIDMTEAGPRLAFGDYAAAEPAGSSEDGGDDFAGGGVAFGVDEIEGVASFGQG